MATRRQREVLQFIRAYIRRNGYSPAISELMAHFKIASPNGILCHLRALERQGLIVRAANVARSIRLVEQQPKRKRSPRKRKATT